MPRSFTPQRSLWLARLSGLLIGSLLLASCYNLRPSNGGAQSEFSSPRKTQAADIAVPEGYRVELVAAGFTFPTGVAFDDEGTAYVVEAGYSYGEVWTTPRLLRIEPSGSFTTIAQGERNGPWNGVAYSSGHFYIAEGGELEGGRILRVDRQGRTETLLDSLPTVGDHHTNGPAIDNVGNVYFALGTATNSGVVGPDNAKYGWLKRKPDFHDVPCRDLRLRDETFSSVDVLSGKNEVRTAAFAPFGRGSPGETVTGRVPCSGAILRIAPQGGEPQLVAWGFRNPFGLAFSGSGQLYVTENGYDDRGSRPVWGTADVLWDVKPNTWYGWPDFSAGQPLTDERFRAPGKPPLEFLLAEHPNLPPAPAAVLGVHSSSNGLDFAPAAFGYEGQAFIAQFGDQAPTVGKVVSPVGFKVVRVDLQTGAIHDFAANRGKTNGPASKFGTEGFERPIAVRFHPRDASMYVVDFGVLRETKQGSVPEPGTGVLWKITRASP
jgi:glucose/arabinose dehydrogenase